MATQDVNFEIGDGSDTNDSGMPTDTGAIKPLIAGERVRAAVLNRPHENLRQRTETLRTEVSNLKYLMDSDVSWIITGGSSIGAVTGDTPPTVTWNPTTGKFVTSADIVVQPIAGPITDKYDSVTYTNVAPWSITIKMDSKRFAGGHLKSLIWTEVAPAVLAPARAAATVTDTPYRTLNIQICNDGTTLVSDVHTALNPIGDGFSHIITGSGVVTFADVTPSTYTFDGVYEREMHYITPAVFASFFAIPNSILSGDTLCIYYEWLVDPTPSTFGGRRQATPTANGGAINTVVSAGQFFLANSYPERLPLAIPICRRIGDALIFVDGTVCMGTPPSEFPTTAVTFGVNQRSLADVASLFSASTGAGIVGVAGHVAHAGASVDRFTISAGTLQTILEALQLFVNDKASLDQNETLAGDWLQSATSAWYVTEASAVNSCRLLWRTGSGRPADSSVTYNTISRYQLNDYGVSTYTSMLVTLTGGYLEYDTSWKIHTPATGSGNVTVEIEINSAPRTSEHNVRGSYRISAAAANSLFELLPADVLTSDYTSGFSTLLSNYYLWGHPGSFFVDFVNVVLTATTATFTTTTTNLVSTTLNVTAPVMVLTAATQLRLNSGSMRIDAIVESEIVNPGDTYSASFHVDPHYHGTIYGSSSSYNGYVNRVIDGFTVMPATTNGRFAANTIMITPGRASVGGKIITIDESVTLTGVCATHRTVLVDGSFYPISGGSKWYGVWLCSNGQFYVGSLPDMGAHNGIPGSTGYTIPSAEVDFAEGFTQKDYTLVDIVWGYDYMGVDDQIRFAGVTHLGGGLCVYHQAQKGSYPDGTWGYYFQHECVTLVVDGSDQSFVACVPTSNATIFADALPGIPTNISGAALLGIYFKQYRASDSDLNVAIFHSNATLVNEAFVSTSKFAPPIAYDPSSYVRGLASCKYPITTGSNTYLAYPLWAFSKDTIEAPGGTTQIAQTLVCPLQRTAANIAGSIGVQFVTNDFSPGDTAELYVTNLGFFWDRYHSGGIY